MRKKDRFVRWVKANKNELIIGGFAAVGTIVVVKNYDSIKGIFKAKDPVVCAVVKTKPVREKIIEPVLSTDIINNLTGNKLTARELGNKVWCSAQAINKRIVAAGLAIKQPCGEYMMTEAGRLLGEVTWKTTAAGHSFSNIEWDEKILEVIFSAEELRNIVAKQEQARQILVA